MSKSDKKDEQDQRDLLARKYSDRELIKRLVHYLYPYRHIFGLALIAMFIGTLLDILQPIILKIAIDDYIIPGDVDGLAIAAILYFVLALISFLLTVISSYYTTVKGLDIVTEIRKDTFYKLQELDMEYYHKEATGRIISRVTSDTERLIDLLSTGIIDAFVNTIFLFILFIILFLLNRTLALTVLLFFPFLAAFVIFLRIKTRNAWQKTRKTLAKVTGSYQETISGIKVSKAFVAEDFLTKEFEELNLENYEARVKALLLFAIMFPTMDILIACATALVLTVGGISVGQETMTVGTLVAFLAYLGRISRPIFLLSNFYNTFLASMASTERIFDILDRESAVVPWDSEKPTNVEGGIQFRKVCFSYEVEGKPVLSKVDFMIPPKSTVALVGHTGAGKTTITNLLCRFYDFNEGEILLDGKDIRYFDIQEYRNWFSVIPQDSFLFSGTIRENLLYGNPNVTEEKIERILLR
ncbi:MAG: ABC transporter ATP-binding protein, partial [Candidatus Hodarchaeota archaeon]